MTQFWPIEPESNPAWGALKKGLLDSEEDSHEKNHLSSFGLCHLWTCLELLYPSCYKPEEEANTGETEITGEFQKYGTRTLTLHPGLPWGFLLHE